MVEVPTVQLPTTATSPDHKSETHEPRTISERTNATATRVGNNIDLINLYARQKDWYKLFEVVGAIGSRFFANAGAKLFGQDHKSLSELSALKDAAISENSVSKLNQYYEAIAKEKAHGAKIAGLSADTLNTGLQLGISSFSNWWEKETLVRVYDKALQQELGIEKPTFKDLKRSENPIIRNAADYYQRKAAWRMLPDFLGMIKWVPEAAKAIAGPESKLYKATSFIEKSDFSGIDLALGGKTAYFLWYFIERQTGGHYALLRIWNKTEGVMDPKNRLVNQNVHPGDLVSQEEITGLYREVAQDRKLRDFTTDDPLTGRLFQQIARYLNHNYVPELYKVKKPGVNHEELAGSHFTHADLVTLCGTAGIDINDSYATAVRIEVIARKGIAEYRDVDSRIHAVHRPEEKSYPDHATFGRAFVAYMNELDTIAKSALGDQWPAMYVEKEIRPGMLESYHLAPEVPAQERFSGSVDKTHSSAMVLAETALASGSQAQADSTYYQQLVASTPSVGVARAHDASPAVSETLAQPTLSSASAESMHHTAQVARSANTSNILAQRDPTLSHSERAEANHGHATAAVRV